LKRAASHLASRPVYRRYSRRSERENVCKLDKNFPQIWGKASDWTVLYLNNIWQICLIYLMCFIWNILANYSSILPLSS
jgi:hypothetical protein